MTTAGGLAFVAVSVDEHLRAFVEPRRLLRQSRLPAGSQATPMTYMVGGTQYMIQAASGHAQLGTTLGNYVVAYALPEQRSRGRQTPGQTAEIPPKASLQRGQMRLDAPGWKIRTLSPRAPGLRASAWPCR